MTERWARIGEHLKNAALYEDPDARPPGQAWRRRLLDHRGGEVIVLDRGSSSLKPLLIFLPLVLLVLLMVFSVWGAYAPAAGDEDGPGGMLKLSMQLLDIQLPAVNIWYLLILGAAVTLITFIARGRAPNFLPLDW